MNKENPVHRNEKKAEHNSNGREEKKDMGDSQDIVKGVRGTELICLNDFLKAFI